MGLDIYSGPLTRYYSKNWKTVVQQWAEENDVEYKTIRPEERKDELIDPIEIQEICEAWRDNLATGLKEHTDATIFWVENNELPYNTDKPDWDGYGAVILWTLYLEQEIPPPVEFNKDWTSSEVYTRSTKEDYQTNFPSLTKDCELWLPIEIDFTFRYPDVAEQEVGIASSYSLLEDLTTLNQNTWNANDEVIEGWRKEIDPNTISFEEKAKFGFAILYEIARFSADNRMPIKLDY